MALSANSNTVAIAAKGSISGKILSAGVVYNNAYLGMYSYTHGTSASRGKVFPWNDENFAIPMGFAEGTGTGVADASVECPVRIDGSVRSCSVVGATGLLDQGRIVYMTDDGTFTLTRPALGHPLGQVVKWVSGTNCNVLFFGLETLTAIGLAGAGRQEWLIGIVSGGGGAGNHATGVLAPYHALITAVTGQVFEPVTDADQDYDVNLEIATVDVTGGVVEFVTADAIGAKKDGTAVTAANEMHEGDAIDIEVVANTAGTAADGYMAIYARLIALPGH